MISSRHSNGAASFPAGPRYRFRTGNRLLAEALALGESEMAA
jgi:hypothetical protein